MKCDFDTITVEDLRTLLKLGHELYDLQSRPDILRLCMLRRLRRLYRARVALSAVVVPLETDKWRYTDLLSVGWSSPRHRERFHAAFKAPAGENPLHPLLLSAESSKSLSRGAVISEADWRETGFHKTILAPVGLFDCLYSRVPLSNNRSSLLALFRAQNDPNPFSRRECVGVHSLHEEVALLGVRQSQSSGSPDWLSPRLHQTLQLLLNGAGEKQVAHSLGLSQHTVHCHIRNLYRRFKVNSRAELLSRFVNN